MIELLMEPTFWATLAILVGLELALGVDNVVLVSLIMARVPEAHRKRARQIGLAVSALVQVVLLIVMLWIAGVERTAFTIMGWSPTWSELAFLAGGVFLIYKAVSELHIHIEFGHHPTPPAPESVSELPFAAAIVQVALINAVFSVDTIITAVGVTRSVETIIATILLTTIVIYFATSPISAFIARHRSVRAVALAFLLMIGGSLMSEGLGYSPNPALLYIAIGTGAAVLLLVKLAQRLRRAPDSVSPETVLREEPTIEPVEPAQPVGTEPAVIAEAEPSANIEDELALEEDEPERAPQEEQPVPDQEVLEDAAPDVQKSPPKRRAPRRKTARKAKASPQR